MKFFALTILVTLSAVLPVYAGMTVITLTDVAEARLQSISFFCVVFLLLALGVMGLWNYLAKSFESHHWVLPEMAGYYAYIPAKSVGGGRKVLVYEPSVMGVERFVLLTDGSIEAWSEDTLKRALEDHE